jgi:nucleotide-binding universal stress UspA family protein
VAEVADLRVHVLTRTGSGARELAAIAVELSADALVTGACPGLAASRRSYWNAFRNGDTFCVRGLSASQKT